MADVVAYGEGLIACPGAGRSRRLCAMQLRRLRETFGDRAYMALTLRRRPNDQLRLHELAIWRPQCACRPSSPTTCCSTSPARRILQDVVTCIRHNVTIDDARIPARAPCRPLSQAAEEMHRLFSRYPEASGPHVEIAERCRFSWTSSPTNIPRKRRCRA
jgi:error-prone DNA polymerase